MTCPVYSVLVYIAYLCLLHSYTGHAQPFLLAQIVTNETHLPNERIMEMKKITLISQPILDTTLPAI